MKVIALLAFCIVATSASKNDLHNNMATNKFKTYWKECMFENGLTKDSFMDMLAKQDFRDAGCAIACMHEKLQLIDEDGNIIFKKYLDLAKKALTYLGHKWNDDIKQILLDCNQLAADITERCEKYLVLSQCSGQRYLEYFGHNLNKSD